MSALALGVVLFGWLLGRTANAQVGRDFLLLGGAVTVTIGVLAFVFRPKAIKTATGGRIIEYAALMPNIVARNLGMSGAPRDNATIAGRVTIGQEGITWRPASLSKMFAAAVVFHSDEIRALSVGGV